MTGSNPQKVGASGLTCRASSCVAAIVKQMHRLQLSSKLAFHLLDSQSCPQVLCVMPYWAWIPNKSTLQRRYLGKLSAAGHLEGDQ